MTFQDYLKSDPTSCPGCRQRDMALAEIFGLTFVRGPDHFYQVSFNVTDPKSFAQACREFLASNEAKKAEGRE